VRNRKTIPHRRTVVEVKRKLLHQSTFCKYLGFQLQRDSITCGVPQGSRLGPLLFSLHGDITFASNLNQHYLQMKQFFSFSAKSIFNLEKSHPRIKY